MKLIINADDYGWDEDSTQGILTLVRAGALSSVSIMANMADDYALKNIALHTNTVSTGIHITLNEGKPLSNPAEVTTLVDENGSFYNSSKLWKRAISGKVKYSHIQKELEAQLGKLRDFGIAISHADSHQHIHQYPFLSKSILDTIASLGVKNVRRCKPESVNDFRRKILLGFHFLSKGNLKSFKSPDVLGTNFAHQKEANMFLFEDFVEKSLNKDYDCVELMCHPALSNRPDSYLNRESEFAFLLYSPWKQFLEEAEVEWVNYRSL